MVCRIVYKNNAPYLELDGTSTYKIRKKRVNAGRGNYEYLIIKLPIGRYPETGAIRQHDVTGLTQEDLIDHVFSRIELSDDEMRLTDTEKTIRQISAEWFKSYAISWTDSTRTRNSQILNRLLDEPIVDRTPHSLDEAEIVAWQEKLLKTVTISTVSCLWNCLRSIMRFSITRHYACFDPMAHVKIFQYMPEEGIALTRHQLWKLLYESRNSQCFILLAVTLLAALRISEAIGLAWSDIDFYNKCIYIHQQCNRNPVTGKMEIIPYTKTKQARRIYPPDCLFWCLQKQKALQAEWAQSPKYENKFNLVITCENGTPVRHSYAADSLESTLDGTDPIGITPHDLRCTCATYGARLTGDLFTVRHYLGHRSRRAIFNYICSDSEDQRKMIKQINDSFSILSGEKKKSRHEKKATCSALLHSGSSI